MTANYYVTFGSSEVLRASDPVKSDLENRDYDRRGSAALTMQHPSIRKNWHQLLREAAVARSVLFACGLNPQS
jgi:hypothetical protein